MISLSVGCDYSEAHVRAILEAVSEVETHNVRVNNVYGSPRGANLIGSVRPSKRETAVFWPEFKKNIAALKVAGINSHITLNSLFPHVKHVGTNENIFKSALARELLDDFIKGCADTGVNTFICSHPYLIEYLHKFDVNIVVSTIMNVHSIGQLEFIKNQWPKVIKVCPSLWSNRDYAFLHSANNILSLELLANEFCSIGGVECDGLFRQSCYLSQSMETTEEYNPLKICSKIREEKPYSWLKARFILPQWMQWYYHRTGVNTFKITGRTHLASFVQFITKAYLSENWDGNLLALWGHLQATFNKGNWNEEQAKVVESLYIDCSKMDKYPYCTNDVNCDFCCVCESLFKVYRKEVL